MNTFLVYYKEPMVATIVAETMDEAYEIFMNGDFDSVEDMDGTIGEPDLITFWPELD